MKLRKEMGSFEMEFADLPVGCPPSDAQPCVGEIYRLVPSLPIDQSGFVSHFDRFPGKKWQDECIAKGLSVQRSYEAICKLRKRFKRGYRDHKVVFASLNPAIGVIKQTKSEGHYTWWPEIGADVPSLFDLYPSETP